MENLDVANMAAQLEVRHDSLNGLRNGDSLSLLGLEKCTVINTGTFPGQPYTKAITIQDGSGNIFVHFYGTGDGNWDYNSVAYGAQPQPSEMQKWALHYFNKTVKDRYEGQSQGNLYVTGHSQGGNNAQFVTMRSEYGDYVSTCVSLDGPGFSHQFIDESKALYGEAFYENQRDKIYAYNGENDYVSLLGQVSIIKDNHEQFIAYSGEDFDFARFHMADGLLKDGRMSPTGDDSQFRKYLGEVLDKVKDLPPEKQARAAQLVMMLCEDFVGEGPIKSNMTSQEFNELKEILAPFLVLVIAEFPDADRINLVLQELKLDVSQPMVESIRNVIDHINTYPPEVREKLIEAFLSTVDYENGKFSWNWSNVPIAIVTAWPLLLETILTHPGDIDTILRELGVYETIVDWIRDNPWQFAGISLSAILFAPVLVPVASAALTAGLMANSLIRTIQGLSEIATKTKETLVQLFTAVMRAITAFQEWLRNNFNAGVNYVRSNPYFKADPAKLRQYATRINNVNRRLRNLDADLRSLYWQVGLLDLWDIMVANLLTSGSPTLTQVNTYLNDAADRLTKADDKSRGYMGG